MPELWVQKQKVGQYYNQSHAQVLAALGAQWTAHLTGVLARLNQTQSSNGSALPPVVVFDIDETSLDNWPYFAAHDYALDPLSWAAWQNSGGAGALGATLGLYRAVLAAGGRAAFITGRKDQDGLLNATAANMQAAGYTQWEQLTCRSPAEFNLTADAYKSARRAVLAQTHNIIGCIGDQVSDCTGGFTGGYVMKIPNYLYFIA